MPALKTFFCLGITLLLPAFPVRTVSGQAQPSDLKPGEAEIRYLRNSGWLVQTAHHVLVFDYIGGATSAPTHTLDHGYISADDLAGQNTIVFTTHGHKDHFDASILSWGDASDSIIYVFGWAEAPGEGHLKLGPRASAQIGDIEVTTIASTDLGVGFLVQVDGLTLLHAGDHAQWTANAATAFQEEIDYLIPYAGKIDIAFFPIATGKFGGCEPRDAIFRGVLEASRKLRPALVVPMHIDCDDKLGLYGDFKARFKARLPDLAAHAVTKHGERFRYGPSGVME